MSNISQIVRTKLYAEGENNPSGIPLDVKNGRILVNVGSPINTTGEANDYYIDSGTGNLYGPKTSDWGPPVYNFVTGAGGSGITSVVNVGTGEGLFDQLTGGGMVAEFKSISTTPLELVIADLGQELQLSINPLYKPTSLSNVNNKYLGGDTFDPNGVIGSDIGASLGSLWGQPPNNIWVCNNAFTKTWALATAGIGIQSNASVGNFQGNVFQSTDGAGISYFRSLAGTFEQINVTRNIDNENINLAMNVNYKPATLSNVTNAAQGYGQLSQPLVTDDDTKGYIKGSLYSEVELSGDVKLWVCTNATTGAATWSVVNDPLTLNEDLFSVYIDSGSLQTSFAGANVSTKLNIGASIPIATFRGSWASDSLGSGAVITRTLPSNGKINNKYLVTYSMELFSTIVVAIDRKYNIVFASGNGSTPSANHILGSSNSCIFHTSSEFATVGGSFVFSTTTNLAESFYPVIISRVGTFDPVFLQLLNISITEV